MSFISDPKIANTLRKGDLIVYDSHGLGRDTHMVLTEVDYYNRTMIGIVGIQKDNMYRSVPMSSDTAKVIRPKIVNEDANFITEEKLRNSIATKNFSPLVYNIINNPDNVDGRFFTPYYFKRFKNRAFAFPTMIEYGSTDKLRIPMWTVNSQGQADIRYLYFSESDGHIHVTPGFEFPSGRLIKADNFGCSYVNGNRVDPEIESYICGLYFRKHGMISESAPYHLKGFTKDLGMSHNPNKPTPNSSYNQYQEFSKEIRTWYGSKIFQILGFHDYSTIPSTWSLVDNISTQEILRKIYAADSFFNKFIDFSNPTRQYNHFNLIKKEYLVTVFSCYLAGSTIEWHIASSGDDYWLENILLNEQKPLNSFGINGLSVHAGGLISKAWEYKSQVGDILLNDPIAYNYLLTDINDGRYVSVEKFLQNNPIARLYKDFQKNNPNFR